MKSQKHLPRIEGAAAWSAAICLVLGSLTASTHAQLIAYEGFIYAPGSQLSAVSGGTGFGANWSATAGAIGTNVSGSMSYGSLTTSGGRVVVGHSAGWPASGGQTASIQRYLPDTFGNMAAAGTGSIWVSMLYQNLGSDQGGFAGFREAKLGFFSGATTNVNGNSNVNGSERLNVGSPNTYAVGANDTLSLFQGSTFVSSGIATPRGTDPANAVFILLRLDVDNTAAADTAYAWFNPNLASEPTTGTAIAFTANDLSGINALRLQAGNANSNGTNAVWQADELRVGNTWAAVTVVPEPSVFAMTGIGALLLAGILRRKN